MYGSKLKELLKNRGLSQTDLANKLNVPITTVNAWTRSEHLKTDVIEKICSALHIDTWEFFLDHEKRSEESGIPADLLPLVDRLKSEQPSHREFLVDAFISIMDSYEKIQLLNHSNRNGRVTVTTDTKKMKS